MPNVDSTLRNLKRVVFLSEDANTINVVSHHLSANGIEVVGFKDVRSLTANMGPVSQTIFVLDTRTLPRNQDVPALMDHIDQLCGCRPILVCIAHSKEIDLRLQARRAGAKAFFVNPVATDELIAELLDLGGVSDPSDNYRVLIVDDEFFAARIASRILEKGGMKTRCVHDAIQVLDVLEEFQPDLVLMDLNMPGTDGIELTTLIREHHVFYDTPVIFLSAELDARKRMDALKVGASDFIAKPVRRERLVETVRRRIRSFRVTH